jgi:hypothetical protein
MHTARRHRSTRDAIDEVPAQLLELANALLQLLDAFGHRGRRLLRDFFRDARDA